MFTLRSVYVIEIDISVQITEAVKSNTEISK
jgi:hypothetical protein